MTLQIATLVPGSETPVGDGRTQATRCVLLTKEGATRAAILKRMARPAVLAETFSAVLLRMWGLNVPDPFLVNDAGSLCFASADATYPSLKQRLGLSKTSTPPTPEEDALIKTGCELVAMLDQTPLALMIDEAIDNRDRNLGNILWDGAEPVWIDHELALGLAGHFPDENKLATMVLRSASGTIESIQKSSLAAWIAVNRSAPQWAAERVGAESEDMADLVAQRLMALGGKILARFPAPDDLLSRA